MFPNDIRAVAVFKLVESNTRCCFPAAFASVFVLILIVPSLSAQPTGYEKVLFPIVSTPTPGAHGSLWMSEVRVTNGDPEESVGLAGGYACFGCRTPVKVPPNITYTLMPLVGILGIPGSFLFVEQGKADHLHYELRVRDLSREEQSWGTEIPVVREREFRGDRINLLNIPLSPLYRRNLRIYTLNPISGAEVLVRIYSQPTGDRGVILGASNDPDRILTELVLSTTNVPKGSFPFSENYPGYAATTIFPVGGYQGPSVRIELVPLTSGIRIWGFVSVTNDRTNDFTVISPQ